MELNRAEVGRHESVMKPFVFNSGETISSLLSKAQITLGEKDIIMGLKSGNVEDANDCAVNGETYVVVTNYKSG
jgi:hypothetical protein